MPDQTAPQHPFTIKVLRLGNPSLHLQEAGLGPSLPTPLLVLPHTTGKVYVGEEFKCLLSISTAHGNVAAATIEIEMTTPTGVQTPRLTNGADPDAKQLTPQEKQLHDAGTIKMTGKMLSAGHEMHRLIQYEPSVTGVHSLMVLAHYEVAGEARVFRKTFRFDVDHAVGVKTRVVGMADPQSHAVVVQVENVSEAALVIEDCAIVAEGSWSVSRTNDTAPSPILRPRDVAQWCFVAQQGSGRELGPLSLSWRREPLGLRGYFNGPPIQI